eukprot:3407037-Ditylum_brightwellii.AAC.1
MRNAGHLILLLRHIAVTVSVTVSSGGEEGCISVCCECADKRCAQVELGIALGGCECRGAG